MKKALVTGANGFIGRALVKELMDNGVEVIALSRQDKGLFPETVRFISCDLNNCEQLFDIIPDRDIDTIFHMAWEGASGASRADYNLQLRNAAITCNIVKAASRMGIRKFVGAGTLAQYECHACAEENNMFPPPTSCYASAKIAAQYMSKAISNAEGIEHVWAVISNSYGINDTTTNFVNTTVKKMLLGERLSFTPAEQNYDFVYITDMIHGIYLCGKNGKANNSYYIGSGAARPLKEFIEVIKNAVDPNIQLHFGEIKYNGKSLSMEALSCKHIFEDTGYAPQVRFEDGIVKTVEWLKSLQ